MIMIPDFEKVYIVFAAPLAFSILSLISAVVAVALNENKEIETTKS
jgi:hypothetical protein